MTDFIDLPPHLTFTLEHDEHKALSLSAEQGVAQIAPHFWISAEEMAKAIDDNSIWVARWVLPDCSGIVLRAASDRNVLLDAISSAGEVTDSGDQGTFPSIHAQVESPNYGRARSRS